MDLSQLMTTLPQAKARTVIRHLRVTTRGCVNHTSEGKVICIWCMEEFFVNKPEISSEAEYRPLRGRLITQPVTNQINAINDKH